MKKLQLPESFLNDKDLSLIFYAAMKNGLISADRDQIKKFIMNGIMHDDCLMGSFSILKENPFTFKGFWFVWLYKRELICGVKC